MRWEPIQTKTTDILTPENEKFRACGLSLSVCVCVCPCGCLRVCVLCSCFLFAFVSHDVRVHFGRVGGWVFLLFMHSSLCDSL